VFRLTDSGQTKGPKKKGGGGGKKKKKDFLLTSNLSAPVLSFQTGEDLPKEDEILATPSTDIANQGSEAFSTTKGLGASSGKKLKLLKQPLGPTAIPSLRANPPHQKNKRGAPKKGRRKKN